MGYGDIRAQGLVKEVLVKWSAVAFYFANLDAQVLLDKN